MLEDIFWWGVTATAFYLIGWVMYFRERGKYRDAATDLVCIMRKHDIGADELRRTEDHDDIRDYLR